MINFVHDRECKSLHRRMVTLYHTPCCLTTALSLSLLPDRGQLVLMPVMRVTIIVDVVPCISCVI